MEHEYETLNEFFAQAEDLGLDADIATRSRNDELYYPRVFEGPRRRRITFSATTLGQKDKDYREYFVYLPGVYYQFEFIASYPKSMILYHVGHYIPRGRGKQELKGFPLPNGKCVGGQGYNIFPSASLAKILTDYWDHGFNLDGGTTNLLRSFMRDLHAQFYGKENSNRDSWHLAFETWEQMSRGEVIDRMNNNG